MAVDFEQFFHGPVPSRDKYLARLFGLFSEQVVHAWCAFPEASYEDLGRPTLYEIGQVRGNTIDFTLRRRDSGSTYVAELKCELEYDNYRYLRLTSAEQLQHHKSTAFRRFLHVARDPETMDVRRGGNPCLWMERSSFGEQWRRQGARPLWTATGSRMCCPLNR